MLSCITGNEISWLYLEYDSSNSAQRELRQFENYVVNSIAVKYKRV
jgi:hypothetical protein